MAEELNKRYQTLVVLWFALLMNVVVFFLFTLFAAPESDSRTPSSLITFALAAVGTLLVILSFVVKGKLLERSVVNQDITLVQKALVVACAMCEVPAVLGLLQRFILNNPTYYLLFVVAMIGTALHFPKREQLQAATYKSGVN